MFKYFIYILIHMLDLFLCTSSLSSLNIFTHHSIDFHYDFPHVGEVVGSSIHALNGDDLKVLVGVAIHAIVGGDQGIGAVTLEGEAVSVKGPVVGVAPDRAHVEVVWYRCKLEKWKLQKLK